MAIVAEARGLVAPYNLKIKRLRIKFAVWCAQACLSLPSHSNFPPCAEGPIMPLTIINWNVQWASSRSPRGSEFLRRSLTHSPEIICFTEAYTSLMAEAGYVISPEPDCGYPI